jgi:hypothetical protein
MNSRIIKELKMCEQCCAQVDSWGEILPGWSLVRATRDGNYMKKGDWGLVEVNDPAFIFSTTPIKDLTYGLTDDEIDRMDINEIDKFHNVCALIETEMVKSLSDRWPINDYAGRGIHMAIWSRLDRAIEKNTDKEYDKFCWLVHHMAQFIEKHSKPIYLHTKSIFS